MVGGEHIFVRTHERLSLLSLGLRSMHIYCPKVCYLLTLDKIDTLRLVYSNFCRYNF